MRRSLPALFTTSLAMLVSFALAHAAATTYNDTLTGSQTASAESATVALNLNASGDLPGILNISLRHEGGNVNGGTFTLTVLPQNADASSSARGRLTGTVTGGTLTLDANGIVSAAGAVRLTVQSGTDEYAGVTGGSGTLSLSADPENSTKLSGPLALDF